MKLKIGEYLQGLNEGKPRSEWLTQKTIAAETKLPEATVSRYVNGYLTRIDVEVIEKLCNYFDCEVSDLIALERQAS